MKTLDDFALGSTKHAEADYIDMLAADPDLAQRSAALLTERSYSDRLTFGGVPFSRTLRPRFLTPRQYTYIQQTCRTLARAMIRLREACVDDPMLRAQLDLTEEEERLALVDPGFSEPSPSLRMDSFWSEHAWHFVECNGEAPAAVAYTDILTNVFLDLPAVHKFQERYTLQPIYSRERFLQEVMTQYAEFRRNRGAHEFPERPRIAIIDWRGVPTSTEFDLFNEYFESKGLECLITTPEELEWSGGRLRVGDFVIDIAYKRVLTSELLAKPEVAKALTAAYVAGRVMVMNAFRAKFLHKKLSLALLHDDAYAYLYTPEQREVILRHIPWTRKVREQHTTYGTGTVDLVPFILDHRDRLVLKPNDDYGGKGVVIGWTVSQAEWEAALAQALDSSYAVQERVVLEKEPYPFIADDGSIAVADLAADTDPYLFGTDCEGILTRLSAEALLNVTAGTGTVTASMLVEPKG